MTERDNIIYRICEKGGLWGHAAIDYLNDEVNGDNFIIECFDQCHTHCALEMWGQDLVMDIISYALRLKNLENHSKSEPSWQA